MKWKFVANFNVKFTSTILILICHNFYNPTDSGAVQITENNLDMVLASNEIVFINFYAEWCRFSNMLMPIFDDASDEVTKAGYGPGRAVMGKVDCDKETTLATRFHVTKYPTLKLFRNGLPVKKEYRGQRSVEAFSEFIKDQLVDPVKIFNSSTELQSLSEDKRHIIAYLDSKEQEEYSLLKKIATGLKEDCEFHAGFADASKIMHPPGQPIIVFRPDRKTEEDQTYIGPMNYDSLNKWAQSKCIPIVREITFHNAEELTEEGLPFLILFHHPTDTESVKIFRKLVQDELLAHRDSINFLTADGLLFEHPLHHLGKTTKDLPLMAIDSFRHMYLFPDSKDMTKAADIQQFLQDLHSGKLHREFHYGPDKNEVDQEVKVTTPPESTFKKLAPSKNRYTLLKDEL